MPELSQTTIVENASEERNDFETAIEECGFGIFNLLLLLVALPGLWATIFETTTMSYVLPAAECDLKLSLFDKGALNALPFAGTLLSAIPWGFIADTFGRKQILVVGLLTGGVLTLCSLLSQTANQLMIFKFFGGLVSCGPVGVFLSYLSEFHGLKHRVYVVIAIGLLNSLPLLLQPIMAYFILPQDYHFDLWGLELRSWKIFIAITAIPALVSGSLFIFFPESPKFLMSQGRNAEALRAFQTIYALNKRKKKETYPISDLYDEAPEKSYRHSLKIAGRRSLSQRRDQLIIRFSDGIKQMRPICSRAYIGLVVLTYTMYFCLVLSVNSIRLWLPQHFATITEMEHQGMTDLSTCNIIAYTLNKTKFTHTTLYTNNDDCEVHIEPASYFNNIIVAGSLVLNYVFTTLIVRFTGNNVLLRVYMLIASCSILGMYWLISATMTLILASVYISYGIVSMTLVLNVSINLFPTVMRTMAVITLMSFGRFGGMVGNFILPLLMSSDCVAIFAFFGFSLYCSTILSLFLPNTTKEALK